jgi:hypothetical protein
MPSTLVVDNIQPRTGTTVTMPAGSTFYAPGAVIQVVNFQTGALATGTTTLPTDNTIPQNTEGNEYMTLSITPKSVTSKLLIDVVWQGSHSAAGIGFTIALFQDSTVNALATSMNSVTSANYQFTTTLRHYMTAGTVSSTTFKVRAGSGTAGTTTFNGWGAAVQYGGVLASSITITEIGA